MKIVSLRLNADEVSLYQAYAESHGLRLSTAIKRLAESQLANQSRPPKRDATALQIERCVSILQLLFANQAAHFNLAALEDSKRLKLMGLAKQHANAVLASYPNLFGNTRFPPPEKSADAAKS